MQHRGKGLHTDQLCTAALRRAGTGSSLTCVGRAQPAIPASGSKDKQRSSQRAKGFRCCQRAVRLVPNGSYPSQLAPWPVQARLASAGMLPRVLTLQLEELMLQSQLCKKNFFYSEECLPPTTAASPPSNKAKTNADLCMHLMHQRQVSSGHRSVCYSLEPG